MRLIDADELLKHKTDHDMISTHLIYNAPTIEAEPVRRGRWIKDEDGNVTCSVCGNGSSNDNFCEHCGAKMEEQE